MNKKRLFLLIIFLTLVSAYVDLPGKMPIKISLGKFKIDTVLNRPEIDFKLGPFKFQRDLAVKKGLDLAGGAHLVFKADMSQIDPEEKGEALDSAKEIIQRRVDLFGLAEPVIRTSRVGEEHRIVVELAGIDEVDQAIGLIGQTAQLDFRLINEATDAAVPFEETGLTGRFLEKAQPAFDQQTGAPMITLTFTEEGKDLFGEITENNVGRRLAILLDQLILMAPVINEPITGGNASITGEDFEVKDVKRFSAQLNGGALPVPFELIEQRNIGPTLGEDSIQESLRAGLIGLLMVVGFMIIYYGFLGVLASLGLVIYGLATLAIYKLIPVTLTLPGMAGFVLTVGMAVDSNILIFERIKEEIRLGKPRPVARELGFGRAWDSIRDANVCTLIICFILFNPFEWSFLNTSGSIRGFALTLGLGVFLSMFTGIIVTRTFLEVFSRKKDPRLGGV
ncbi:MAG: protein translocase subunit SecD [Candidatus Pacebacteria bacterium]|nr:protein translocase subunit SecD [Candidatus Paceibacterota bacterium]